MDKRIKEMTLEEKARILCGYANMGTYPVDRLNIRSLRFSDGPHGLRIEGADNNLGGISKSKCATTFPTGVNLAGTWNKDLIKTVGSAMGKEACFYNIDVVLGPAVNIKKDPRCGRNFEYYSEDPILAGVIGANFINGMQEHKVGACMKHFACNNNETTRFTGESVVDQRALHEIYLKPFEIITREAHPYAVMTAYNRINGDHCSENSYIQDTILRKKWGFDGFSMTDWGGTKDRVLGLKAGTDLEMPGMVEHNVQLIIEACNKGDLSLDVIDESVNRLLEVSKKTSKEECKDYDFSNGYDVALQAGLESGVLLKNNGVLPLKKENKIHVIGEFFEHAKYQGSGSSLLNPAIFTSHKDYFDKVGIKYSYSQGYISFDNKKNKKLEDEAINNCKDAETIVYYVGQNDFVESEGFDRESVTLSENQISLLNRLIELKKKIVLVIFGGSFIELPFFDQVDSILYMGLAGESIGESTTKLLFGEVSPSGRLTETWPLVLKDAPFNEEFIKSPYWLYKESIFVGYRYYQSTNKEVRFPFGYGLSYTDFEYSDFKVKKEKDHIKVIVKVKNIGNIEGKEVIQIYSSKLNSNVYRPIKELKGFDKVSLLPNEEKEVEVNIPLSYLEVFDVNVDDFVLEEGKYKFILGKDASKEIASEVIELEGKKIKTDNDLVKKYYWDLSNLLTMTNEDYSKISGVDVPYYKKSKRPYTLETPLGEFKTPVGKIFAHATMNVGMKQFKKASKLPYSSLKEREMKSGIFVYKMMPNNSLRSLAFVAGKGFTYEFALVMLDFINNRFISGIKKLRKIKK